MKCILVFMSGLFFVGCASSFKNEIYKSMVVGGLAGGLYGASKTEQKSANTVMWAGLGAAAGAALAVYMSDPEDSSKALKAETGRLKSELERLEKSKVKAQSTAFMGARVPAKYQHLIQPGEWRVLQIDEWIEDGENRLIHRDQVMELVPPALLPR